MGRAARLILLIGLAFQYFAVGVHAQFMSYGIPADDVVMIRQEGSTSSIDGDQATELRKAIRKLELPFLVVIIFDDRSPGWDDNSWMRVDDEWREQATLLIGVFPASDRYIIRPNDSLAPSLPLEDCRRVAEKEFSFYFEEGDYSAGILSTLEELNTLYTPVVDKDRKKLGQTLITVGILILIITMLRYWRIARGKRPEYRPKVIKAEEIVEPEDIPPDEQVEAKEEPSQS